MVVAILAGATAVGKSALAQRLAERNGFEIISADSRQIYRDLPIGTGAPDSADRARVTHHLVGVLDPSETSSPREYPARVHALLAARPQTRFLIVGGTGLYLKELLYPAAMDRGPTPEAIRKKVQERLAAEGLAAIHAELSRLDPEALKAVHPNDAYRLAKRLENVYITGQAYSAFAGPGTPDPRFQGAPLLWLDDEREALYARIEARIRAMAAAGWQDEVKVLMARPGWRDLPAMSSLGYREMAEVVEGRMSLDQALADIAKKTRNYAKRQITFFRHQFPAAERWTPEGLRRALERAEWNWERFRDSAAAGRGASEDPVRKP